MKKKGANYFQDKKIHEDKEKKENIVKTKLNAVKKKVVLAVRTRGTQEGGKGSGR